jgi:hypothetical protein
MPNWCQDKLIISGKVKDLKRFRDNFKGKPANWELQEFDLWNLTDDQKAEAIKKNEEEYANMEPTYCFNALYPVPKEILEIGFDGQFYWLPKIKQQIISKEITEKFKDEIAEEVKKYGLAEVIKKYKVPLNNLTAVLTQEQWFEQIALCKHKLYFEDPKFDQMAREEFTVRYSTSNSAMYPDGFNWSTSHWGTKWDVNGHVDDYTCEDIDKMSDEESYELWFEFDTAWSPPDELVKKVALDFPELQFKLYYYEGGEGFSGEFLLNCDDAKDQYYDRNKDHENYVRIIVENFDDEYEQDEDDQTVIQLQIPAQINTLEEVKQID